MTTEIKTLNENHWMRVVDIMKYKKTLSDKEQEIYMKGYKDGQELHYSLENLITQLIQAREWKVLKQMNTILGVPESSDEMILLNKMIQKDEEDDKKIPWYKKIFYQIMLWWSVSVFGGNIFQ